MYQCHDVSQMQIDGHLKPVWHQMNQPKWMQSIINPLCLLWMKLCLVNFTSMVNLYKWRPCKHLSVGCNACYQSKEMTIYPQRSWKSWPSHGEKNDINSELWHFPFFQSLNRTLGHHWLNFNPGRQVVNSIFLSDGVNLFQP